MIPGRGEHPSPWQHWQSSRAACHWFTLDHMLSLNQSRWLEGCKTPLGVSLTWTTSTEEGKRPPQKRYQHRLGINFLPCSNDIGWGFPAGTGVKNPPASAGDTGDAGSIPGSGRSPGGGNGNPLQDPCLENPMDRRAIAREVARVGLNLATKPPLPPRDLGLAKGK